MSKIPRELFYLLKAQHLEGVISLLDWMSFDAHRLTLVLDTPASQTILVNFISQFGPLSEHVAKQVLCEVR